MFIPKNLLYITLTILAFLIQITNIKTNKGFHLTYLEKNASIFFQINNCHIIINLYPAPNPIVATLFLIKIIFQTLKDSILNFWKKMLAFFFKLLYYSNFFIDYTYSKKSTLNPILSYSIHCQPLSNTLSTFNQVIVNL
jgi:hypothetical protein